MDDVRLQRDCFSVKEAFFILAKNAHVYWSDDK